MSRYHNWETWTQYFAWTAFYSFFFVFCLSHTGLLDRIIGNILTKAISWIGKISFSLYLIHFPLFKLFGYLHREVFEEKPANFLISLFYLLPLIFLAWLFFRWVEDPIHQWSKKKRNLCKRASKDLWFRTQLETLLCEPFLISSTIRTNWKSFLPPLELEKEPTS